jgi:hypothetical protein
MLLQQLDPSSGFNILTLFIWAVKRRSKKSSTKIMQKQGRLN